VIKLMLQKDIKIKGGHILVLGVTFKENCPDVRNTKVVDVIRELQSFGTQVTVFDPWANPEEVMHEYHLKTLNQLPNSQFDAIILAVAHKEFLTLNLKAFLNPKGIMYDVKGVLDEIVDGRL